MGDEPAAVHRRAARRVPRRGAGRAALPPHLYAVAELARRRRAGDDGIRAEAQTQALLVSGESGAGKTEAVKILLAYVCQHDHARCAELPQQLVEINPLLEAFGNACTALNANSSRFGKLLSLQYDRDGRLCGGAITPYLLEKVRVVRHAADERSFHVFYQMLRGLPRDELARLRLAEPDAAEVAEHRYLRSPADTPALGAAVSPAQPPSGGSGRSSVGFTPASALATPAGRAYAATSAAGAAGEGSGRTSPTSTPMHLSPTFGEETSEEEERHHGALGGGVARDGARGRGGRHRRCRAARPHRAPRGRAPPRETSASKSGKRRTPRRRRR